MKMTLSLIASLLLTSSVFAADVNCRDEIPKKQQAVADAQTRYEAGEGTIVELLTAKIDLADTQYGCGQYVKYNYCHYKQTLLGAKIRNTSGADQDAAKQALEGFKAFCLDPKQ